MRTTSHKHFETLCNALDGTAGVAEPGALGDVDEVVLMDAEDQEDAALGNLEALDAAALMHPGEFAEAVPHHARPPFSVPGPGGKVLKVNFDFWSHRSKLQRGYLTCPYHVGCSCIKYRFVHLHASHQECAAWIFAWAAQAHGKDWDKRQHLAEPPLPSDVKHFMEAVANIGN